MGFHRIANWRVGESTHKPASFSYVTFWYNEYSNTLLIARIVFILLGGQAICGWPRTNVFHSASDQSCLWAPSAAGLGALHGKSRAVLSYDRRGKEISWISSYVGDASKYLIPWRLN